MGCDIHSKAERWSGQKWEVIPGVLPFDWRSYSVFAFLAGVRNYSEIPPIASPRGVPDDCEIDQYELGEHSFSWLTIAELEAFDYDQQIEDRRAVRQVAPNLWNGAATADPGEGQPMTYRMYLNEGFFEELAKLKSLGAERIVFGFDN